MSNSGNARTTPDVSFLAGAPTPVTHDSVVYTGPGHDTILDYGSGNDRLYGGGLYNVIRAGSGNDIVYGGYGTNQLYAGTGNDVLVGGGSLNFLYGGLGRDVLISGPGQSFLGSSGIGVGGMGNWETGTREEEACILVSSMLPLLCWASWAGMIPGAAWYVPPFRPTRNPEYPLFLETELSPLIRISWSIGPAACTPAC
jgi:hypothetical protein